ncbi:hypothetical protein CLAFUW4_11564 [Fulvia fulva]|uniref:SnoaL-like domain-containing protein n=1 Tax=Passalora fulva TaxID=5499 RepID=A0A9Q8PCI6_PASFU|nr:uncharacterized protein CLAFUR5_10607 [Fulvia fulva]KAK4619721.1 hypothetical protein CLAFUR4_11569 [Fulvia fulva]KAK4620731.1 hypothetical protein CLAFUR0_11578 [Fulvia fulva]UJO19969.1 hypothetical protein CLAFUR5_10607 [Fulvia fulva]WPV17772.1 hypothetical protein CLAFUW4_11564 [Fulvia fulva]WPV31832.1 hypothetical protein CLAFUW7_11568 [Fulvia fulva]
MCSISAEGEACTTSESPKETDDLIKVRTKALTINYALNTRDFGLLSDCLSENFVGHWAFFPDTALDKDSFIDSIRHNAEQYPNWQCKAIDIYLHGKGKSRQGLPEWISMMVDCQQTGVPDGIVRKTFMLLEFRRPETEGAVAGSGAEWLCTSLKATQGLVAGDVWFI